MSVQSKRSAQRLRWAQPPGQDGLLGGPPIPAEASAELLVIKDGGVFLCARPDGDIRAHSQRRGSVPEDTRISPN